MLFRSYLPLNALLVSSRCGLEDDAKSGNGACGTEASSLRRAVGGSAGAAGLPQTGDLFGGESIQVDFWMYLKTMRKEGRAAHRSVAGEGMPPTTGPPPVSFGWRPIPL